MVRRRVSLVGLRLSVLLACTASCSQGARQEAAQVAEAMDRFRKAENPSKPAMLSALANVQCSHPDVCSARAACVASAEPTATSLRLKSEVEQALRAVEKGNLAKDTAEAEALGPKLDQAETLLKQGFAALPACDDHIMRLRRKYAF